MASSSTIITQGYGTFGAVAVVVTQGYGVNQNVATAWKTYSVTTPTAGSQSVVGRPPNP